MSGTSLQTANRQIARATGTVMAAIIISQLIGLLAKTLAAQAFGTSPAYDAYAAANRLTEILFNLVAGGALASAFLPVFVGMLATEKQAAAWNLASSIFNLVSLILVLLSALAFIFSAWLVNHVLAPGFVLADPEKAALTAHLLRIQLLSPILFGISGLMMGILNAHQKFLLPALAPSMYSIGKIIGLVLLKPGLGIDGLAWGVVLGAALHLLIQLPQFLRLPNRTYRFNFDIQSPLVREVARLMGPRLLGVAFVQLNFLANTFLASRQPDGSVSSLDYAFTLMLMPQAAIAQAMAIAALPTFSAQVARGKKDEMRSSLTTTLRSVILLSLPAAVGLAVLATPIVRLIYQYNAFSAASTEMVAWALLWYAVGLVGHSVVEIVSRAFYALHDTKTPVMVGVAAMSLNIGLSLLFSAWFRRLGWMPHGGLALANSLATFLEMIALLLFMRNRLQGLEGKRILQAVLAAGLASTAMAGAVLGLQAWLAAIPVLWMVLLALVFGAVLYGLVILLLRVEEPLILWKGILRRLGISKA